MRDYWYIAAVALLALWAVVAGSSVVAFAITAVRRPERVAERCEVLVGGSQTNKGTRGKVGPRARDCESGGPCGEIGVSPLSGNVQARRREEWKGPGTQSNR